MTIHSVADYESASNRRNVSERMENGDVNKTLGSKIRFYRNLLGLSQKRLAEAIGVTFQLVQKYENGSIRISVSRLYDIAGALGVPVTALLGDDANATPKGSPVAEMPPVLGSLTPEAAGPVGDVDQRLQNESFELLRAFYGVSNGEVRRRILDLVEATAEGAPKRNGD